MWTPDTAKSHPPAVQTFCLWGEANQKKVGQNGEELKKNFFFKQRMNWGLLQESMIWKLCKVTLGPKIKKIWSWKWAEWLHCLYLRAASPPLETCFWWNSVYASCHEIFLGEPFMWGVTPHWRMIDCVPVIRWPWGVNNFRKHCNRNENKAAETQ